MVWRHSQSHAPFVLFNLFTSLPCNVVTCRTNRRMARCWSETNTRQLAIILLVSRGNELEESWPNDRRTLLLFLHVAQCLVLPPPSTSIHRFTALFLLFYLLSSSRSYSVSRLVYPNPESSYNGAQVSQWLHKKKLYIQVTPSKAFRSMQSAGRREYIWFELTAQPRTAHITARIQVYSYMAFSFYIFVYLLLSPYKSCSACLSVFLHIHFHRLWRILLPSFCSFFIYLFTYFVNPTFFFGHLSAGS